MFFKCIKANIIKQTCDRDFTLMLSSDLFKFVSDASKPSKKASKSFEYNLRQSSYHFSQ